MISDEFHWKAINNHSPFGKHFTTWKHLKGMNFMHAFTERNRGHRVHVHRVPCKYEGRSIKFEYRGRSWWSQWLCRWFCKNAEIKKNRGTQKIISFIRLSEIQVVERYDNLFSKIFPVKGFFMRDTTPKRLNRGPDLGSGLLLNWSLIFESGEYCIYKGFIWNRFLLECGIFEEILSLRKQVPKQWRNRAN